ncbi:hypothetical protein V1527DRAFT_476042 [Lipomyces starkeyi]
MMIPIIGHVWCVLVLTSCTINRQCQCYLGWIFEDTISTKSLNNIGDFKIPVFEITLDGYSCTILDSCFWLKWHGSLAQVEYMCKFCLACCK